MFLVLHLFTESGIKYFTQGFYQLSQQIILMKYNCKQSLETLNKNIFFIK